MISELLLEHLYIIFTAGVLSVLIGLPLGIAAYVYPRLRSLILRVVDLLQTVPALALLGMIMVLCGAGKVTVIIGITLYSLLPIVRNTLVGLQGVNAGIKEAARGMGMTQLYRLIHVELPLAFPVIFTGIRIAIVNAIGTAVFAAFVGGGGLGSILVRSIRIQNMRMLLYGTAALMVMAFVLDWFMGAMERFVENNRSQIGKKMAAVLACMLVALVVVLPMGIQEKPAGKTLVMYDGDYTETQVMHHMLKQLIEANTDLNVDLRDQMSQVNNFKAMRGDDYTCDLMLSYDGTLLTTFLHLDPVDVPEGESLYDFVNRVGREREHMYLLKKLGFNNTYAVAVPQKLADKYKLDEVSDLIPLAPKLIFGGEHEFFTQEGSMKYGPFVKFYGLDFKKSVSVDVSLKYAAIENGSYDVTEVFATDGLNKKAKLKILKDDKNFFPEYNGCVMVREDTFEKFAPVAPNLEEVLNSLAGKISNEDMSSMTYAVDVEGRNMDEVAREFLVGRGLVPGVAYKDGKPLKMAKK